MNNYSIFMQNAVPDFNFSLKVYSAQLKNITSFPPPQHAFSLNKEVKKQRLTQCQKWSVDDCLDSYIGHCIDADVCFDIYSKYLW